MKRRDAARYGNQFDFQLERFTGLQDPAPAARRVQSRVDIAHPFEYERRVIDLAGDRGGQRTAVADEQDRRNIDSDADAVDRWRSRCVQADDENGEREKSQAEGPESFVQQDKNQCQRNAGRKQ